MSVDFSFENTSDEDAGFVTGVARAYLQYLEQNNLKHSEKLFKSVKRDLLHKMCDFYMNWSKDLTLSEHISTFYSEQYAKEFMENIAI
jgi:hypothetical protein